MPVLKSKSYIEEIQDTANNVLQEFANTHKNSFSRIFEAQNSVVSLPMLQMQKEVTEMTKSLNSMFDRNFFKSVQSIVETQKKQSEFVVHLIKPAQLEFAKSAVEAMNNAMNFNKQMYDFAKITDHFKHFLAPKTFNYNNRTPGESKVLEVSEYEIGEIEEPVTSKHSTGLFLMSVGISLLDQQKPPSVNPNAINDLQLLTTGEFAYRSKVINTITTNSREGRLLKLLVMSPYNHATINIIEAEFQDHTFDLHKLKEYIIKAFKHENLNIEIKSIRTNGYRLVSINPIH